MAEQDSRSDLEVYTKAPDIWKAMYTDCEQAKKTIELEQYILKDDKAGHKFIKLFTEKVKQGVEVRLMLDSIGSRGLLLSSAFSEFKEAGGVAYFYNPIDFCSAFMPPKWLPRNHIKTLLIDSDICYTGSACIWEETSDWHDLQMRFAGGMADDVREDFFRLWVEADKKKIPLIRNAPASGNFSYVVSQFGIKPNRIYRKLLHGIHNARRNVRIVTPYFLPPWLLRRALYKAIKRGVDVQVMVSEKSDVGFADYVSHSYYPTLFRHGVRVFHYQQTVLHAKYAIIDDDWATIGSANMDYLSLLKNREANIFTTDAGVVVKIREDFDRCMTNCREVNMAYYRRIVWWQKALGYLGRCMRRIL